jgi:hypothetical protein
VLYVATACRTLYVGDAPEFATSGAVWGVPHPPGYPLHTLLEGIFVRVLRVGSMALRANLFSSLCAAIAVALAYRIARRFVSLPSALAAALCLANGATFWSQAVVAEVYALDLVLAAASWLALLVWLESPTRKRAALAGLLAGLWIGHRPPNLVYAAVIAIVAIVAQRRVKRPIAQLWPALAAGAASGLVYLYLPIAAHGHPALDLGDPETPHRFWRVVSAEIYRGHFSTVDWERSARFFPMLPAELGVGALAAPFGLFALGRRRALPILVCVAACLAIVARHAILDLAPWYLPAIAVLVPASAVGFERLPSKLRWLAVALALVGLPWHFGANNLRRATLVDDWGSDALAAAPPGALVLASGDTSVTALRYLQAVEHVRPDVAVVVPSSADDWYVAQLRREHPDVPWPPDETVDEGTWPAALLDSALGRRPVCLIHPPELSLPAWRAADYLAKWRGAPEGLLFCFARADAPPDQAQLDRTESFWRTARPVDIPSLKGADVQVLMTAFYYPVARFAQAAALLEAGRVDEARAQLEAVRAFDPDTIEGHMHEAYALMGRSLNPMLLGRRADRALATTDPAAMLRALSRE